MLTINNLRPKPSVDHHAEVMRHMVDMLRPSYLRQTDDHITHSNSVRVR